MFISTGDMLLSVFFILGLCQYFWLSVVLVRKGLNPSLVRLCLTIFMAIWVLVWPAYEDGRIIMLSVLLFLLPSAYVWQQSTPFARHLRLCWHSTGKENQQPAPWLMLLTSLFLAATLFDQSPTLGLAVALSLCLAWSAAELIDKSDRGIRLGFSANPQQTWLGHGVFILGSSFLSLWSLQLYDSSMTWQSGLVLGLIASLVVAILRALLRHGWNMPFAMMGMGITLFSLA